MIPIWRVDTHTHIIPSIIHIFFISYVLGNLSGSVGPGRVANRVNKQYSRNQQEGEHKLQHFVGTNIRSKRRNAGFLATLAGTWCRIHCEAFQMDDETFRCAPNVQFLAWSFATSSSLAVGPVILNQCSRWGIITTSGKLLLTWHNMTQQAIDSPGNCFYCHLYWLIWFVCLLTLHHLFWLIVNKKEVHQGP